MSDDCLGCLNVRGAVSAQEHGLTISDIAKSCSVIALKAARKYGLASTVDALCADCRDRLRRLEESRQ